MVTIELPDNAAFRRYVIHWLGERLAEGEPGDSESIRAHEALIADLGGDAESACLDNGHAADIGCYLSGIAVDFFEDNTHDAVAMLYFGLLLQERARR